MVRALAPVVAVFVLFSAACKSAPEEAHSSQASSTTSSGSSASAGSGGAGGAAGTGGAGGASMSSAGGAGGAGGASPEAGTGASCSVDGAPGECLEVAACSALSGYTSTPGHCPGPADIECCTVTPNVADNPPTPTGYEPMMQAEVTPAMTTWAVAILDDPSGYPLFATTTMTFGTLLVLARVEWHPPDFQNSVVHRGVTLYQPI